ncbi:hypothetical protein HDE_01481 [Halotydeus destructor]|nr:hypothetical protein HDE_01481 [Halotydeus destructor]
MSLKSIELSFLIVSTYLFVVFTVSDCCSPTGKAKAYLCDYLQRATLAGNASHHDTCHASPPTTPDPESAIVCFLVGLLKTTSFFVGGLLVVLLVHRVLFDDNDYLCGFGHPQMISGSHWLFDEDAVQDAIYEPPPILRLPFACRGRG